jgi:hypothetical protein
MRDWSDIRRGVDGYHGRKGRAKPSVSFFQHHLQLNSDLRSRLEQFVPCRLVQFWEMGDGGVISVSLLVRFAAEMQHGERTVVRILASRFPQSSSELPPLYSPKFTTLQRARQQPSLAKLLF